MVFLRRLPNLGVEAGEDVMAGLGHNEIRRARSRKTEQDRGGLMVAGRRRSPSTRAGEYVREEIHHAREGKHPVKNREQAIAIGLSKARRKGIRVPARKR